MAVSPSVAARGYVESPADEEFEAALDALQRYEAARESLHAVLAEARFALSSARLELGSRHVDVSLACIPTTLTPQATAHADASSGLEIVLEAPTIPKATAGAAAGKAAAKATVMEAEGELQLGEKNPLYWFTLSPSAELRRAQQLFQRSLFAAADAANTQRSLLARTVHCGPTE